MNFKEKVKAYPDDQSRSLSTNHEKYVFKHSCTHVTVSDIEYLVCSSSAPLRSSVGQNRDRPKMLLTPIIARLRIVVGFNTNWKDYHVSGGDGAKRGG